jgi:cytochrome P450
MDLARLETLIGVRTLLTELPGLVLDERHPTAPSGLVFRKPQTLHVRWER